MRAQRPPKKTRGPVAGAATVGQSGDWNLKCTSGPSKGAKRVLAAEPTHKEMTDLCPDGIAKATQRAFGPNGKTILTIRCDIDKGTNGKAKKVELDHEPTVAELVAGAYTADAGSTPSDSGSD